MADMLGARSYCGCAVLGNRVYFVGGEDSGWQPLATVVCFDPVRETWHQVQGLIFLFVLERVKMREIERWSAREQKGERK